MLKNLMAALDGTPASDPVLALGIRWACRFDATLVALTVVDEPGLHGSEELLVGESYFRKLNAEILAELREQAERALGRYSQRCSEEGVTLKALEQVGDPASQILLEAQRFDLILLASRPNFRVGWGGADAGTASTVLKNAPRPVVVVPETDPPAPEGPVVVAYDGSLQAARALASFGATGLGNDRAVHVVSVGPEADSKAERAAEYLSAHGIRPSVHCDPSDATPADLLLERVRAVSAGLLVMGAYGQPRLKEFFLGSTTRTLLARSPVPVLVDH